MASVVTILPPALPVPAAQGGVSAAVDVRTIGGNLTAHLNASDGDVVAIDGSPDGVNLWAPFMVAQNNVTVRQPEASVVGFIRLRRARVDPTPGGGPTAPNISLVGQPLPEGYSFGTANLVIPAGDGVGASVSVAQLGITSEVTRSPTKAVVCSAFDAGDQLTIEASADGNAPWVTVMQLQALTITPIPGSFAFVRVRRARIPAAGPRVGVDGATCAFMGQGVAPPGGVADVVSFGADPSGAADSTAAIQAAFAAMPDQSALVFPAGIYKTTDRVTVAANHIRVIGYGAKINQTGVLKGGLLVTGQDVAIEGLWLFNNRGGADWSGAGPTAAIGVEFSGSGSSRISNCRIENWGGIGVKYLTSPGLLIERCRIIGIGAAGGLVSGSNNNLGTAGYGSGAGSNGVRIQHNFFSDLAQGAFQGNDWSDTTVLGNWFTNMVGQNAIYFDNVFNCSIVGNIIDTCGQVGIYLQVANNATQDGGGVAVVGNTVQTCGQDGIVVIAGQGGLANFFRGLVIAGNTVRAATGNGIQVGQVDNYEVLGNILDTPGRFGIFCNSTARGGRVAHNRIINSANAAMYIASQVVGDPVVIERNIMRGCNTAVSGTTYENSQLFISTGTFVVRDNIVQAPNANAVWNLYTDATCTYTLVNNAWASALASTLGGTLALNKRVVIAWATVSPYLRPDLSLGNEFFISVGNATITQLSAPINATSENRITVRINNAFGNPGQVNLVAAYKLSDGATTFPMPQNGYATSIDFQYDGANWIEVGRSSLLLYQAAPLKVGTAIASAGVIAPTAPITHITGVGAIATITPPANFALNGTGGRLTLIPDGAFTWTAAGNIAVAGNAAIGKALDMTYDNGTAKWYPSYLV